MTDVEKIVQALEAGDVGLLTQLNVDRSSLSDDAVAVALRRAAEKVVWHRVDHRTTIERVIELGARCDIWTAARAGLVDAVGKLIASDKRLLDKEDDEGCTPLQRAALIYGGCDECEQVVDFLLQAGAKVDIFTASTFCMPEVVHAELERDPKLVKQRRVGSTPLNWAVRPRRNNNAATEICQALIDAGADVHDADEYESGMTPLHHAAEWGPKICLPIVDLLIESGADISAKDQQGWTALQYAQDRGRQEMIEHLVKLGAT